MNPCCRVCDWGGCRGKKFVSNSASPKLECGDCKAVFKTQSEAGKHAQSTGHVNFKQVK